MTSRPSLAATSRTETGKAAARLRKHGRIPAVVYGHGPSVSISIDSHDLDLIRRQVGANTLVDLAIDTTAPAAVLVQKIQLHTVARHPIHVDFFRVAMKEAMTVDVAVHGTGSSDAVDKLGGTLLHSIDHVRVRALPDQLPSTFEIDLAVLATFDAVIRAGDLALPEGVELITDPDEIVLRVNPPRVADVAAGETADAPAPLPAESV